MRELSRSKARLITLTEILIIPHITKPNSIIVLLYISIHKNT